MAKSNIIIKNIKLNMTQDELEMITESLNLYIEDLETANDDLSLRTIDVGKHNFYKVDKGLCEHTRKWYIKYIRLATQLNRLNNKISCVDDLPWRSTKQLARAT
tara:strand:+ start:1323 stop:1634 length:312 start_codon:yes stop_codon:yes gene_type:complete